MCMRNTMRSREELRPANRRDTSCESGRSGSDVVSRKRKAQTGASAPQARDSKDTDLAGFAIDASCGGTTRTALRRGNRWARRELQPRSQMPAVEAGEIPRITRVSGASSPNLQCWKRMNSKSFTFSEWWVKVAGNQSRWRSCWRRETAPSWREVPG